MSSRLSSWFSLLCGPAPPVADRTFSRISGGRSLARLAARARVISLPVSSAARPAATLRPCAWFRVPTRNPGSRGPLSRSASTPATPAPSRVRKQSRGTCARLANELVEAADERVVSRVVARYGRLDLLLLETSCLKSHHHYRRHSSLGYLTPARFGCDLYPLMNDSHMLHTALGF